MKKGNIISILSNSVTKYLAKLFKFCLHGKIPGSTKSAGFVAINSAAWFYHIWLRF